MPVHETSIRYSTKHVTVDRRFAAILEEDFAIPAAKVLDALEGEPQKQAIRICSWAARTDNPAEVLLAWAKKHRRGRCHGHGRISSRPTVDRSGRGQDIAARPDVSRDDSLRGLADAGVLDRIAARLRGS